MIISTTALQDYRLKHNTSQPYAFTCTSEGIFCNDCRELILCSRDLSTGQLQQSLYMSCRYDEICDSSNQCKKPPAFPPCSPISHVGFVCSKPGMYPDPGDCKKYYICAPDNSGVLTAHGYDCRSEGTGRGFGYDPKSTFCNKLLSNDQCSGYPIPLCTGLQSAALAANPTLYYDCKPYPNDPTVLYPFQSRCDNGKKYTPIYDCR
ncbi:hypothetical protein ILUMI_26444 [Ignelater luminosus]|uniref:Chitin-binding type-2 domain-containing protein n=1 Tax=Ignelater luminosus TaxID=2038154 RepID=A0A8K0C6P8_IGNLU|nr:hypothetical protein ILUMI_26444 [Ignelater luminosus]